MKTLKAVIASLLFVGIVAVAGCNATADAQHFESVLNGIIQIAQAEVPALPPADGAILKQWTDLGVTLDAQLRGCIAGNTGGKTATFLACFNSFAAGIASPAELAQLRILSPASQSKVQLYVTAAILGVNAALVAFKGTAAPVPQVGSAPAPSNAELRGLAKQLNVSYGY
jgi:hypothetical protein